MNYTHHIILERIEELYANIGTLEKVYGDIFVLTDQPQPQDDDGMEL